MKTLAGSEGHLSKRTCHTDAWEQGHPKYWGHATQQYRGKITD